MDAPVLAPALRCWTLLIPCFVFREPDCLLTQDKMAGVDAFLQARHIPEAVKRRVRWYYEWVWLVRALLSSMPAFQTLPPWAP